MSEKRDRLYLSVDRLAFKKVSENGNGNARSLWLAMEDLAFKNAGKYPGKSFVIDLVELGKYAGISFSTVKRINRDFEDLGLVSIKRRRKRGSCRFDRLFYTLHYPKQPIDQFGLRSHRPCNNLDKQLGEASKCPAADAASPLALRHFDASPQKRKTDPVDAEAAAKYKAEQAVAAEERKRQQEAELAERKERERLEKEERLERWRVADEKQKADQEAAKLAEDARRLAMRTDVSSCVASIREAVFDEYDPGTLPMRLRDFDGSTVKAAVNKLRPDMSDKVRACMKNNEWDF